jgi:hypothetical protein
VQVIGILIRTHIARRIVMVNRARAVFVYLLAAVLVAGTHVQILAAIPGVVGGSANGATVTGTVTVLGIPVSVSLVSAAPVTIPSSGGSASNQVASVGVAVPGVVSVLSTGLIVNTSSGTLTPSTGHIDSTSTVNGLNILNSLITATTIVSHATSDFNGTIATSTGTGSQITNLMIAGQPVVTASVAPNTVLSVSANISVNVGGLPLNLPVSGTVTLNEQIRGGNGTTTASITVNQLHVNVSGSVAGFINLSVNIIIASASSGIDFSVPSAVKLGNVEAVRQKDGVSLNWRTGSEVSNLGFNIYREQNGKRTRISPQLIAGSALLAGNRTSLTAGNAYSWKDKNSQGTDARYWLEDVDLNGQSTWHGPITSVNSSGVDHQQESSVDLSSLGSNESASSDGQAERKARPFKVSQERLNLQSDLAARAAVKLAVKKEGWFRVTQPMLIAAGLDREADPRLLQLYADGKELPIIITGEQDGRFDSNDAIEFYGIGLDTASTNKRIYWLAAGATAGKLIQTIKGKGQQSAGQNFPYTVERCDRTLYFASLKNGETENFFGPVISKEPVTQTLNLINLDSLASERAQLEVTLQGVTEGHHRVKVLLNDSDVGALDFDGQMQGKASFSIKQARLRQGSNNVKLVSSGSDTDVSLIDSLRLTYRHTYTADNEELRFTASNKQRVTVDGFSSNRVRLLDVTDPDDVRKVSTQISSTERGYAITAAAPKGGQRTLFAFSEARGRQVDAITANQISSLRNKDQAANMVIITHKDFAGNIEPLVRLRESQGLRVAVVDIEDVYDEFSFGQKSPQAVKDFMRFASSEWKTAPAYLLFVGDASLDSRNYLGIGDFDLVPTKLIDTAYLEAASDDWFADFNGDGVAEIAVGRLPARTDQEAATMVSKIIAYERSAKTGGVLLVSDSNDENDFEAASNQLKGTIPAGERIVEINRGQMDASTAKLQFMEAMLRGQRIVNYMGHGSIDLWKGDLLTSADARELSNGASQPLFVSMTCLNGYFHDARLESLAEALIKAERGGAVAVWASSGMTQVREQALMNKHLYQSLFNGEGTSGLTLGEAIAKAKAAVGDRDVRQTWILFGDPAMTLK